MRYVPGAVIHINLSVFESNVSYSENVMPTRDVYLDQWFTFLLGVYFNIKLGVLSNDSFFQMWTVSFL